MSIVFLMGGTLLFSQHKLLVFNNDNSAVFSKLEFQKNFPTKESTEKEIRRIVLSLQGEGYLLCTADSIVHDSLEHKLYLTIGEPYRWMRLGRGNAESNLLAGINYSERLYSKRVFKSAEVRKLMEKILVYYENHGYPFADVKLDSVAINGKEISGVLRVSKNKLIKIDSVLNTGDLRISKKFLYRYLDVKPGSFYNEAVLKSIPQKIKQLPFARETKPMQVRLTEKTNKVLLFVAKRNSSQFDGIIGLLPTAGGKTVFTGDAKIKLQNSIFRAGETVELNWRRLQSQTQDLKTRISYPYLFNTPAGIEHSLKLYRRDTTFIDVLNNIGVQYIFRGLNYVKGFYRQRNSNILSTNGLQALTTLPDYADIVTRAYGLGVYYEKLDYKLNPRKGISLSVNTSAGSRLIRKNAKLNEVIYNGVKLKSNQYQGELDFAGYIPLFKKATIKLGTQAATVISDQVFKNELFRIGGLKTLRGFDEESIFASTYAIGTFEFRYLLDENSAVYLFSDAAIYEKSFIATYEKDIPFGVGAGMSFETKAGIFTLSYAIGKQFNNPLDVRSGKIHFGIVNAF